MSVRKVGFACPVQNSLDVIAFDFTLLPLVMYGYGSSAHLQVMVDSRTDLAL